MSDAMLEFRDVDVFYGAIQALKQAGEGLEQAIRRDLNAVIGTELDRVVINGTGTAGNPRRPSHRRQTSDPDTPP